MQHATDIAVSLVILMLPSTAIIWAWRNRVTPARALRVKLCFCALTALTVDVVYSGVFLLWPYFGATPGSGVYRWEHTLSLVGYGFWLSALAMVSALAANPGKLRRLLIVLSIAAVAFWFSMQTPVSDFLAVERARQAASRAP